MELLGIDPNEHIQNVIDGMKDVAEQLEIRAEDRRR
jgi:hypothetical protein